MPKRTDIKSILVIGAGPIVIGQACEFDYSGVQACKALKDEGYRVILVNSNPATIMTDPGLADATYIEPITPDMVAKIIEKERPDAILPTMGGQTALNTAMALHRDGRLEKLRRRADRRQRRGDRQGRGSPAVPRGHDQDRPRMPKSEVVHNREEAASALDHVGLPAIIRPSFTLGGTGGGIAYNRDEFFDIVQGGLDASPVDRGAGRGIGARLERVRDGGRARPPRQLHHHLLDRERRSDGHPHRRFGHGRAGADAHRQGIPDHAQRLDRVPARDRRRYRRIERAVRGRSRRPAAWS